MASHGTAGSNMSIGASVLLFARNSHIRGQSSTILNIISWLSLTFLFMQILGKKQEFKASDRSTDDKLIKSSCLCMCQCPWEVEWLSDLGHMSWVSWEKVLTSQGGSSVWVCVCVLLCLIQLQTFIMDIMRSGCFAKQYTGHGWGRWSREVCPAHSI